MSTLQESVESSKKIHTYDTAMQYNSAKNLKQALDDLIDATGIKKILIKLLDKLERMLK